MSYGQEHIDIETRLSDNFSMSGVALSFENKKLDDTDMSTNTSYVHTVIRDGLATQVCFGSSTVTDRNVGVIICQIFIKKELGQGLALRISDAIDTIFRRQVFSGITCQVPRVDHVGESQDQVWYQTNLSIDFFRDETS